MSRDEVIAAAAAEVTRRLSTIEIEHAEHVKAILFALLGSREGWRARVEVTGSGLVLVVEMAK